MPGCPEPGTARRRGAKGGGKGASPSPARSGALRRRAGVAKTMPGTGGGVLGAGGASLRAFPGRGFAAGPPNGGPKRRGTGALAGAP